MAVPRNDQSRPTANHNYPSLPCTAIPAAHQSSSIPSMVDKQLRRVIETTLRLSSHQPVPLRSNRCSMTLPEATVHGRRHLEMIYGIVTIALHKINSGTGSGRWISSFRIY